MIIAVALTAIIACNAPAVHDGDSLRYGSERVSG
jgi:micrococcal nuclease